MKSGERTDRDTERRRKTGGYTKAEIHVGTDLQNIKGGMMKANVTLGIRHISTVEFATVWIKREGATLDWAFGIIEKRREKENQTIMRYRGCFIYVCKVGNSR